MMPQTQIFLLTTAYAVCSVILTGCLAVVASESFERLGQLLDWYEDRKNEGRENEGRENEGREN